MKSAKTAGYFRFSHLALLCLFIAVVAKIFGFSSADIRSEAKEQAVIQSETLSPEQSILRKFETEKSNINNASKICITAINANIKSSQNESSTTDSLDQSMNKIRKKTDTFWECRKQEALQIKTIKRAKFKAIKKLKETKILNVYKDLPAMGTSPKNAEAKLLQICFGKSNYSFEHCGSFLGQYVERIHPSYKEKFIVQKKLDRLSFYFKHDYAIWEKLVRKISQEFSHSSTGYCFYPTIISEKVNLTAAIFNKSSKCMKWFENGTVLLQSFVSDEDYSSISLEFRHGSNTFTAPEGFEVNSP